MYMIRGCNFDKSDTICKEVADKYSHKELTPFFFTSGRKRMTSFSTNLEDPADDYNCRAQMKGASEKVLEQCNKYMNDEGKVVELDDAARRVIGDQITVYARDALRTIAIAYKDVQRGECGEKHDDEKIAQAKPEDN